MFDFLKTLGEGVLYTLLSPLILIFVLVNMIYCFLLFFVMFIKRIIMFFQGKDMSIDSELDKAAKYHIKFFRKGMLNKEEPAPAPSPAPQQTTIVQPIIIQTGPDGRIRASNIDVDNAPQNNNKKYPNEEPLDMTTKEISYDELRRSQTKGGDYRE